MNPGTYRQNDGREVCIEGLAKCDPIEGQAIYWSVQGDWFAEDGRRVGLSVIRAPGRSLFDGAKRFLYSADNYRSLAKEKTDAV